METGPKEYETVTFCWSCGSSGNCPCGVDRVLVTRVPPKEVLPICSGASAYDDIWNLDGSPRIHTCLTTGGVKKLLKFGNNFKKIKNKF